MANYIGSRRYRTMTIKQAQAAAPMPISGDPPRTRKILHRVRVIDLPPIEESIGDTPEGKPIFVPVFKCVLHGFVVTCECQN